MGQSLCIEAIGTKGNSIGTMYFHWNGNTSEALTRSLELIEYFENPDKYNLPVDEKLRLIRISEKYFGGINRLDLNDIKQKFPKEKFKIEADRNSGLVSITPHNMDITIRNSQYYVVVDFSNSIYMDKSISKYDNIEDLKNDYEDEILEEDIHIYNHDLSNLIFKNLVYALNDLNKYSRFLKISDTNTYNWIIPAL